MVGCKVGKLIFSETKRILLFQESAINKSPNALTANAVGYLSSAKRAGPPSPELPGVPVPAMGRESE